MARLLLAGGLLLEFVHSGCSLLAYADQFDVGIGVALLGAVPAANRLAGFIFHRLVEP